MIYQKPSEIAGIGTFADAAFTKGEKLFTIESSGYRTINHSCAPNCSMHGRSVLAARDIAQFEELTINYRLIPFAVKPMTFDCNCGSEHCRGRIQID